MLLSGKVPQLFWSIINQTIIKSKMSSGIVYLLQKYKSSHSGASLVAWMVKTLLTMPETWILSLGQEDALEKGMATHSSVLGANVCVLSHFRYVQLFATYGLYLAKLFCPWDSTGQNTGVGFHALHQVILLI